MMINKATIATLAMFRILNPQHRKMVSTIPVIIEYTDFGNSQTQPMATTDPTKFDLNRSIESLFESFSSGEITKIMDNNAQKTSNCLNLRYNKYPITKPIRHRMI